MKTTIDLKFEMVQQPSSCRLFLRPIWTETEGGSSLDWNPIFDSYIFSRGNNSKKEVLKEAKKLGIKNKDIINLKDFNFAKD